MRFGGKELDAESALMNFEARYYRNTWGRFTQVDPVGGSLGDTQSWNRYAYGRNNPLRFVDPTGLAYRIWADDQAVGFADISYAELYDWAQEAGLEVLGGPLGGDFGTRWGVIAGSYEYTCSPKNCEYGEYGGSNRRSDPPGGDPGGGDPGGGSGCDKCRQDPPTPDPPDPCKVSPSSCAPPPTPPCTANCPPPPGPTPNDSKKEHATDNRPWWQRVVSPCGGRGTKRNPSIADRVRMTDGLYTMADGFALIEVGGALITGTAEALAFAGPTGGATVALVAVAGPAIVGGTIASFGGGAWMVGQGWHEYWEGRCSE